jgi:hypothetical protein
MNSPQIIRTTSFSLWTMGHRRYYSPMIHAAGGPPATDTMVTPRIRPSLVLRNVRGPELDGTTETPASGEHHGH